MTARAVFVDHQKLLLSALPRPRLAVLAIGTVLLAADDILPIQGLVDTDRAGEVICLLLGGLVLLMAIADRATPAAVVKYAQLGALAGISLGVSLVAAEFLVRRVFADVTTMADNGGYFSRRWLASGAVRTNGDGFRDRDWPRAKAAGAYRIAVVGDSFTFGNGIPQTSRFSDLIQAWQPQHLELLNFGVAGANTPNHLWTLKQKVLPYRPDFVLLQWYVNDVEGNSAAGRPDYRPLVPLAAAHDVLQRTSALYDVAQSQWVTLQVRLGLAESYPHYVDRRMRDPHGRDAQADVQAMRALVDAAHAHGLAVGIVLFPDAAQDLGPSYPYGYLHERVLQICDDTRITCVDLRADFATLRDRTALWANRFDAHPGPRANLIAAMRIMRAFAATWLIAPPPP